MLEITYREAVVLSEILIRTKRMHAANLSQPSLPEVTATLLEEIAAIDALVPRIVTRVILQQLSPSPDPT